jgi:hypothetical protein
MKVEEQWENHTVEEFCKVVYECHDHPCLECYCGKLCFEEWYKKNKNIKLKDIKED